MSQIIGLIGQNHSEIAESNILAFDRLANKIVCPSKKFIARTKDPLQALTKKIADKNYTLIFHGHLYNKEQLRNQLLQQGYTFTTNSDLEVLLSGYAEWGRTCIEKLTGIYAFALWSEQDETLLLARDRLGVKRLFYKIEDDQLIFATDYRDLVAINHESPVINEDTIAEFIVFGLKHSFYRHIKEVQPAHLLIYDQKGVTNYCYWQLESKKHFQGINETADQIRNIIVDTIEKQLIHERSVSTILSEDVETSILVALASNVLNRAGNEKLKAYSFHTKDEEHNELLKKWIKNFHLDVKNETITEEQIRNVLLKMELPFLLNKSDSALSSLMFQQMSRDPSVLLSHVGANELFGTYEAYFEKENIEIDDFLFVRKAKEIEQCLNEKWKNKLQLSKYIYDQYEETIDSVEVVKGDNEKEIQRRQIAYAVLKWSMIPFMQQIDQWNELVERKVYFPFADHRLIEYMWNIPFEMKQLGGFDKGILRKAFEGIVPYDVLYQQKKSHINKQQIELKRMKENIESLLEKDDSLLLEWFDKQRLQQLLQFQGTLSEQLKKGKLLLSFIQIEQWLKANVY